jgi:SAM-dependent methyltransferase
MERTMSDQYIEIADDYDRTFAQIPYRPFMEAFTVFRTLGDVAGQSVLDVGCGTGLYPRELRRRGAVPVVGVDVSEEMIRVARTHEAADPLGITYLVEDAARLDVIGSFDLAIGIYLLHYSPSADILHRMCRNIVKNLKPGGRFLSYQYNPDVMRTSGYYQKYGIGVQAPETMSDGQPFTFSLTIGHTVTPPITVFHWSRAAVDAALLDAGLTSIRWIKPDVPPQAIEQFGEEYWHNILTVPLCMLIECTKPAV